VQFMFQLAPQHLFLSVTFLFATDEDQPTEDQRQKPAERPQKSGLEGATASRMIGITAKIVPRFSDATLRHLMPSFDIVSEVDKQEVDNALNQARKEVSNRFDFKGATAEILLEKEKIVLTANDATHLHGLREIVVGKLSKRGVDLRNIDQQEPAISSIGHARQELAIKQGLEGDKAKEIIQAIKSQNLKVQSQLMDRQIRVTGKKRDDLQAVIQFVRDRDFGVATNFKNFRD
jgi:cyclic-di-GMP-binding protein